MVALTSTRKLSPSCNNFLIYLCSLYIYAHSLSLIKKRYLAAKFKQHIFVKINITRLANCLAIIQSINQSVISDNNSARLPQINELPLLAKLPPVLWIQKLIVGDAPLISVVVEPGFQLLPVLPTSSLSGNIGTSSVLEAIHSGLGWNRASLDIAAVESYLLMSQLVIC